MIRDCHKEISVDWKQLLTSFFVQKVAVEAVKGSVTIVNRVATHPADAS